MVLFTFNRIARLTGLFSLLPLLLVVTTSVQLHSQNCLSDAGRGLGSVNCGGDHVDVCQAELSFNENRPRPFGEECRFITYAFVNGTDDIPGDYEHQVIERALAKWDKVCGAVFIPACSVREADVRFRWDFLDGDRPGRIDRFAETCVAPGGCSLSTQFGDVIFDSSNTWTTDPIENWDNEANLESAALHEIGHILGIGHTPYAGYADFYENVMDNLFFNLQGSQTYLGCNDIANAHFLHGPQREEVIGSNTVFAQPSRSHKYSIGCIPEGYEARWIVDYPFTIVGSRTGASVTLSLDPNTRSASPRVGVELINRGCGSLQLMKRVKVIGGSITTGPGCTICPIPLTEPTDEPRKTTATTFTVSPNPVVSGENVQVLLQDQTGVKSADVSNSVNEVLIYNISGKEVLRSTSSAPINTSSLSPGMYLVKVAVSSDSPHVTRKLIVR